MADEEPSLLDMLMHYGGTRLPTGGVQIPSSLLDMLRASGGADPRLWSLFDAAVQRGSSGGPQETNVYWDARHPKEGGTNQIIEALQAPGAGHYRIVSSIDHARRSIEEGEHPIVYPPEDAVHGFDVGRLPRLQEEQWAAPGGTPWFLSAPGGALSLNPEVWPTRNERGAPSTLDERL